MTTVPEGLPDAAKGRLDLGELAGMLAARFRRFRVETHSNEYGGTAQAVVTVIGYVTDGDVRTLLQWADDAPDARRVTFPVEEGESVCLSLTWREGEAS